MESERAAPFDLQPFDLQEKLKASGEKCVHGKARKLVDEVERVDREFAELVDQYQQMEQRHREAAEHTREQQQTRHAHAGKNCGVFKRK